MKNFFEFLFDSCRVLFTEKDQMWLVSFKKTLFLAIKKINNRVFQCLKKIYVVDVYF